MRGFLAALVALIALPASAATWYVRTDGGQYGTTSTTCNGQTDAAFTGANGPSCAVDHPFEVLGVFGATPRVTRIAAGDTVIITDGSYKMGYLSGTYDSGNCTAASAYDCTMDEIPSGVSAAAKTKIYGEGWNTGCSTKPELWGASRANYVFNMNGSSNIDVRCLDITDHDDCGTGSLAAGAPNACVDASPYTARTHARTGVFAYNGTDNAFTDVDVHGLENQGFLIGKQTDLVMTDVNVLGNGLAGIDQDTANADDSFAGDNLFTRVKINWNGCAENYPLDGNYNSCIDQNDTGYGDGWGSTTTAGNFTFTDCEFRFNTSDGLDMLYHDDATALVTVESTIFEGNIGNDIKCGGNKAVIRNNVIIANCGFFDGFPSKGTNISVCRAGGNNIVLDVGAGNTFDIVNNSIVGEPDILIEVFGCDGSEVINVKNNAIQGTTQWGGGDTTSWFYAYNGCVQGDILTGSNNVINGVKEGDPCSGQTNCVTTDPLFASANYTTEAFDLLIGAGSPAVDTGLAAGTVVGQTTVPSDDYRGLNRDASVDIGAYEYGASSPTPQADFSGTTLSGGTVQ